MVAIGIQHLAEVEHQRWAGFHTEATALTFIGVELY
jgi:hypothetical protein